MPYKNSNFKIHLLKIVPIKFINYERCLLYTFNILIFQYYFHLNCFIK